MRLSAVCLLSLAVAACSNVPEPAGTALFRSSTSAQSISARRLSCFQQGIAGPADFVSKKLRKLDSFNVETNGGTGEGGGRYTAPVFQDAYLPELDEYRPDIEAVFRSAPPFFKEHLCALDYVFVDMANRTSAPAWGFWESEKDQDPRGRWFVGLSPRILKARSGVLERETSVTRDLLRYSWNGQMGYGSGPRNPSDPQYSYVSALLGIVAHEVGHIRWRNDEVLKTLACDPFAGSWSKVGRQEQRFHRFGVDFNESVAIGDRRKNVRQDLPSRPNAAAAKLGTLFRSGQWASLFATVAPDEDFAETYRLLVMTSATPALTDLWIGIPIGGQIQSFNIIDSFNDANSVLSRKKACIASAL